MLISESSLNDLELTHRQSLLDSVYLVLSDPSYNVRSIRDHANSRYDVLNDEGMANAVDLYRRVMRLATRGDLFRAK